MIRRLYALLILLCLFLSAQAQDNTTKPKPRPRPNIPGSFIVDFGMNGTMGSPEFWSQGFFGSRTVNLYYQYPMRFGRSRFSFNPGAGLSLERFRFKNYRTLSNPKEANLNAQVEKYEFVAASTLFNDPRKIMFVNNYFEVPVEFRYDTKPEDITRSFNVAVGARAGFLIDSFVKMTYHEDGQKKKDKDKQDFGLTQFRYGVYTRVGVGGFNWFFFYNLTPLFRSGMGPGENGTTMNTFTAGISLNGF